MVKTWFLTGVVLLLLCLLVGCGVAQEQYDAVVADLGKAQQELQSVKAELGTTQAKASELTSSLEKANTELETSQTKVSELTSSLEKAQAELEVTKAKNSELTSSLDESRSKNQALEQANDRLRRLTFYVAAFCSEKPNHPNYKPILDNTYMANETVYIYCRVTGVKHSLVDQKLQVDGSFSIKIVNAEGKVVRSQSGRISQSQEKPQAYYWFWWEWKGLEAGNYTAEVEITDNISGETATWKEGFQVIKSTKLNGGTI